VGFVLFIVAIILVSILTVVGLIVTPIIYLVTFRWKSGVKEIDKYFLKLAICLDVFGNISSAKLLQATMTKRGVHQFGKLETVSYVLGRSKYSNDLTRFGKFIVKLLHVLERNHVEKAIEIKRINDLEAVIRAEENKYYE